MKTSDGEFFWTADFADSADGPGAGIARWLVAALVSLTFLSTGWSQDVADAVGILPGDRRAASVAETARNPFAKKEVPKLEIEEAPDNTASEENQIRAVLDGLRVTGRTRGADGWKVLFGDLILENGTTLPPVLEGQTQTLRVVQIFETVMEIEWIETQPSEPTRKIFIPIRLEPRVTEALSGGSAAAGANGSRVPMVVTKQPREVAKDARAAR